MKEQHPIISSSITRFFNRSRYIGVALSQNLVLFYKVEYNLYGYGSIKEIKPLFPSSLSFTEREDEKEGGKVKLTSLIGTVVNDNNDESINNINNTDESPISQQVLSGDIGGTTIKSQSLKISSDNGNNIYIGSSSRNEDPKEGDWKTEIISNGSLGFYRYMLQDGGKYVWVLSQTVSSP